MVPATHVTYDIRTLRLSILGFNLGGLEFSNTVTPCYVHTSAFYSKNRQVKNWTIFLPISVKPSIET